MAIVTRITVVRKKMKEANATIVRVLLSTR